MSALAKVWNDGPTDYKEKFREDDIFIPKGQFVEMDRFDAAAFVSQYIKPKKTDTGQHLNHKMLRVENPKDSGMAVEHRCAMCRGLFANEKELAAHSVEFHSGSIIKSEEDEKPVKRK